MSGRRLGDYPSRSLANHCAKAEESRRSYSGRVSGSARARPEPNSRREYDNRRYYDGERERDRRPLEPAGLSAGLPLSESTSMKFEWNNLLARRPAVSTANPGLNRPDFGFSSGSGKVGVPDPGVDPTRKLAYFHGGFPAALPKPHVGIQKVEDFRLGDHNAYMGPEDKAVFANGPARSSILDPGFHGVSDEFNTSQITGLHQSVDAGWGWRNPKWDYNAPAYGVREVPRPPVYNASLRAGTQEISQWNQYPNFMDQTQPTVLNYQSLSEQSISGYDEVLGSSPRTRSFGFGRDDGLERGREALSYEGTLKKLAPLEGDQRLDELTTLQMCAMRKRALARKLRRNESNSELSNDSSDACDVPDVSFGYDQWSNEDFKHYGIVGQDQLNIDQAVTCGEGQWNVDQGVNFGVNRVNINQNLNFGEDQWYTDRDAIYGEDHRGPNHVVDHWKAEDVNKLNSDNLLPSSKLPVPVQQRHGEQFQSARLDVKKRLGPLKSPGSIKKRLGPLKSSVSVKRRLGPLQSPGSVKKHPRPAQDVPNLDFSDYKPHDQYKSQIRKTDDFSGSIHPQGDDIPKVKAKPAEMELPEDSEEFKKLVDSAFFKHIKRLHENPALRRQLTGGGSFTTKCCVCASNSKEFAGVVPLAIHAFMSRMAGSRAEHLGFHKALCVLMGWDSASVSNGTWVQRFLPDDEALALKEDMVIFPPVVVIHNTSLANKNPNKRVIVTIEGLEDILKGIGFGGGKAKVCRGKPANYSILVVTFNATFSGFREAERLHKLFAENKHGRAEFQQITSASLSNSSSEGKQNSLEDQENCLYGYVGLAEDFDKLESDTKKRCRVKSKKEIQATAITYL
ncbi:unnamed protein product [Malus baccata var. baccata]